MTGVYSTESENVHFWVLGFLEAMLVVGLV